MTGIREGVIIPNPDFQRRLVWSQRHKNAFIRTVLDKYPFPEVYFANGEVDLESGKGSTLIVDGQQRLTTLFEYFHGSESLQLEPGVLAYKELEEDQKRAFLDYDVVVRDLGSLTMEQVREVFLRINSTSYAVNPMEIANARYDGAIKRFGERVASHYLFEYGRVFTANDIRRMNDVRLCLTIVISMHSGYFNRDDEIEPYLSEYNDVFPKEEELLSRFESVSTLLLSLNLQPGHRIWKKSDILTAIVELDGYFVRGMRPRESVLARILEVFDEIDPSRVGGSAAADELMDISGALSEADLETYFKAAVQASNDRLNRYRRGEVFRLMVEPAYF